MPQQHDLSFLPCLRLKRRDHDVEDRIRNAIMHISLPDLIPHASADGVFGRTRLHALFPVFAGNACTASFAYLLKSAGGSGLCEDRALSILPRQSAHGGW